MQKMKTLMDFFKDNIEILENFSDIIEVLLKKAHSDNLSGELKKQVVDMG